MTISSTATSVKRQSVKLCSVAFIASITEKLIGLVPMGVVSIGFVSMGLFSA
ncbi:hypothetical protein PI95_024300 [Hassallia byssoidea VB512170]|uniref:Uncharacterized protein n=1 Tax=Hassallia byssoidea VB512170 TaxID=1304833 RepID=A0A846HES9_9CYAN|nr:hypothetical protein [Hassalia byssoidea VB512170]